MRIPSALVLLVFILIGCEPAPDKGAQLIPIDSLLNGQVKLLMERKAQINKVTSIGNTKSETLYDPADTIAWKKELEVFYHLDVINRPVNRPYYNISESTTAEGKVKVIKLADSDKSDQVPIQSLTLTTDGPDGTVKSIYAVVKEKNVMYSGTRNLTLQFSASGRGAILRGYNIEGGQKMFLGDTVLYVIEGKITTH